MTENKLKALVSEAVELDREVASTTERLKELKALLVAEAVGRKEEHVKTDGGGASWSAEGNDGCIVRVSFPCPSLKSSIDGEGKVIKAVRKLAGKWFSQLFIQAPKYELVPNFREEAAKLTGSSAKALIKAVESKSSPRVSFETKESEGA